jgi:hypothetical protein
MATIGRLVELLRDEARAARDEGDQGAHERLRELADDIGEMSSQQQAWVALADDDQLREFVREVRLQGGGTGST